MEVLVARLRKRHDKQLKHDLKLLKLESGELSELIRRGLKMAIEERTIDDLKLFERRNGDGETTECN